MRVVSLYLYISDLDNDTNIRFMNLFQKYISDLDNDTNIRFMNLFQSKINE